MSTASRKGQTFERLIANDLSAALQDDRIDIRVKRGTNDRGDISGVRTAHGEKVVIECKNHRTHNLSGWLEEAHAEAGNDDAPVGVVVFKRHGRGKADDQYVLMDLAGFKRLLIGEWP